jgi:predicted metal-binding membrane protein
VSTLALLQKPRSRAALSFLGAACSAAWVWSLYLGAPLSGHGHGHGALAPLFAMWAAMMVAMMLPPETPAFLGLASAGHELGARRLAALGAFLFGYLLPWIAFSLGAAYLQIRLQAAGLLDGQMATGSPGLAAAFLLAAGAMQLSPLKRACLDRCRAPIPASAASTQAFNDGIRRGALSTGSCGLLMLVLFVTGVMSIPWMTALTALLVVEKGERAGSRVSAAAGVLLCAWGVWRLTGA